MKIRLAWVLSGKIKKQYSLEYAGDEVVITQVRDILRQAKNRFKIQGRQYIMVAGDKTFYLAKDRKDWNVYQVGVDLSEEH